ncbi:uncharacterized protein LOC105281056 [Ooceraea biroi]|uniref:uncharacterized protein LOC105281056 n=1 Tax=Ooceraea biroi TaxID=2015173 RepID=UPI0005B792FD|nr:uncharacterized protein LOC105281056 [Ooceraea biroi]
MSKCEGELKNVEIPYIYFEDTFQDDQYQSVKLKGVSNQLEKWPNNVFISFVIACLVISLMLCPFVMIIFQSSSDHCCEQKIFEDEHPFNIYFVKEASQLWSTRDFCYIEAAARKQPELNIHLINLMRTSNAFNIPEVHLEMALATQNANIHVENLLVDEFFSKSRLSNITKHLSNELLLMAAKAYLLWNSSGVAMHPSAYCNLSTIHKCRWIKERNQDCTLNKSITIDLMNDLQATQVHCQAFLGFFLQEISKNATQSLKDALDKFCPRIDNCPEVRVLNLESPCSIDVFDCPTVYTIENSWALTL